MSRQLGSGLCTVLVPIFAKLFHIRFTILASISKFILVVLIAFIQIFIDTLIN